MYCIHVCYYMYNVPDMVCIILKSQHNIGSLCLCLRLCRHDAPTLDRSSQWHHHSPRCTVSWQTISNPYNSHHNLAWTTAARETIYPYILPPAQPWQAEGEEKNTRWHAYTTPTDTVQSDDATYWHCGAGAGGGRIWSRSYQWDTSSPHTG